MQPDFFSYINKTVSKDEIEEMGVCGRQTPGLLFALIFVSAGSFLRSLKRRVRFLNTEASDLPECHGKYSRDDVLTHYKELT